MPRSFPPTVRCLALTTLAAVLLACGGDGTSEDAEPRIVEVSMTDNEFTAPAMKVAKGDTVTFEFVNDGEFEHEAVIGDEAVQAEHEAEMSKPGSGVTLPQAGSEATPHTHSDAVGAAVTVAPGERGTLTHTFDEPGTMLVGCHIPGHYDDGMVFEVEVT